MRIFRFHQIIIIALILAISGCTVQKSPITGQKRLYAYTWQQEIQLGRDADKQIIDYYGLYEDEELTSYITEVGKNVLNVSHMRRENTDPQFRSTPFTFRVLNSPVVNAFALPGGYNYVTIGLLTHMTSEAQLAMVLGHEVAHVAARHASQQALKQQAGSLLLIGTAILGQELLGLPGQDIVNLGGAAAQLLFLSYSRDAERESDRLGVEYAAKAGYDASKGAAFFTTLRRLSDQAGSSIPTFMSSHPDPGQRERDIVSRSEQWRNQGFEQNIVNQDRFYAAIEGLIIGENPREGFVRDQNFYHPDLAFLFQVPDDWKLFNEPSQVILFSKDQKAITIFDISEASSAQEAIGKITEIEGLRVQSRNNIRINGNQSVRLLATLQSGGKDYSLHVTAIEHNNRVYQFLSYSLSSDFEQFRLRFDESSNSFNSLTDNSILNIQPTRVRIVSVESPTRFSELLPAEMPHGITRESMAILNQVSMDEIIPSGSLIKLF